jgi:flagellar basal body-associated protein FliL
MIFMAECFTFGGRESTRIVLGNIKDTSSNVLLLLLPLVVFFLSLSLFVNFVLGSQQARDKKKKHEAQDTNSSQKHSVSFLHACCRYLQIISLTHYPVLCISALSCSRLFFIQSCCQASSHQQDVNKPNSYSKWQKED